MKPDTMSWFPGVSSGWRDSGVVTLEAGQGGREGVRRKGRQQNFQSLLIQPDVPFLQEAFLATLPVKSTPSSGS